MGKWKNHPRPEPLDLKKIAEEVEEKMKNPEKYRKLPDPELDIIVADASFIFTKFIPNPKLLDFSHLKFKIPETTFNSIKGKGWNITESITHKTDHWYAGQDPWVYWKPFEIGKIEKGIGITTIVDPAVIEAASPTMKSKWTFEAFKALFPVQDKDKAQFTWLQEGQDIIRTNFPFILWAGEFNYLETIETIRVRKLMIPETTLWPSELGGLFIESYRSKQLKPGEEYTP